MLKRAWVFWQSWRIFSTMGVLGHEDPEFRQFVVEELKRGLHASH